MQNEFELFSMGATAILIFFFQSSGARSKMHRSRTLKETKMLAV